MVKSPSQAISYQQVSRHQGHGASASVCMIFQAGIGLLFPVYDWTDVEFRQAPEIGSGDNILLRICPYYVIADTATPARVLPEYLLCNQVGYLAISGCHFSGGSPLRLCA
jgi:hypothetical protein